MLKISHLRPDGMPKIVSHGGYTSAHPENTIAAFSSAAGAGVDMIEMDIHETSDGGFVVHHHSRLSKDSPLWRDISSAEIREMMGDDPRAPGLVSCLDAIGRIPVNLDVKSCREASNIVRYFRNKPLPADSILSSFNYKLLVQLHKIGFELPLFLNTSISAKRPVLHNIRSAAFSLFPRFVPRHLCGLSVNQRLTTERLVRSLHRRGFLIYVWTADDLGHIRTLSEWGVDGIITNLPTPLATNNSKQEVHYDSFPTF